MSSPSPQSPRRWLLKNTDSFAGFAHAINTFISGVSLAHRFGFGLLHRPQPMAHSLGYTFDSFFALDRRGVAVAPVFAPTLEIANKSMLIDGRVVALKVITAAAADNASLLGDWLSDTPPDTIVWLRKGRAAMPADWAEASTPRAVLGSGNASSAVVCLTEDLKAAAEKESLTSYSAS